MDTDNENHNSRGEAGVEEREGDNHEGVENGNEGLPAANHILRPSRLTRVEYRSLIDDVRRGNLRDVHFYYSLPLVLDNIDQVCTLLSSQRAVESVFFAVRNFSPDGVLGGRLRLTEEQEIAWKKLLSVVSRFNRADVHIQIGGGLSIKKVTQIVQMVQMVSCPRSLHLHIPCHITLSSNDQAKLLQTIMEYADRVVVIDLLGQSYYSIFEGSLAAHSMVEGSLLSNLFQLQRPMGVILRSVILTLQECRSFAHLVSSKSCAIRSLCFDEGSRFLNNGGVAVAEAMGKNKSITSLGLHPGFDDENFKDRALFEALENNYTLKSLFRGDRCNTDMAGAIASLNQAGRKYLRKDSASAESCVKVLDGVKDNLNALYYHIRSADPIIFYGIAPDAIPGCETLASGPRGIKRAHSLISKN